MGIKIPKRLESVFRSNEEPELEDLLSDVKKLIKNTNKILSGSPEFFPNYTIHGVPHVNTVLEYADKLIPDDTLNKILTPYDVAYLICAVVLHDFGMFLSKASVRKLLSSKCQETLFDKLGDRSWEEEWKAYLDHIKRYSREQLSYNFGIVALGKLPDITSDNLCDVDKLIIGEFLRRHHPRIAHDIAVSTLLGAQDQDVFRNTAFSEKNREAIGILARSHGMDIRKTEDYIDEHLGAPYKRLYYLMTVLRLADYLDAGQDRAPESIQHLYGINIPVSKREWDWNQVIIESECLWENSSRYITAEPSSTTIFVQVEKWLNNVRNELDMCWAVIAEKYPEQGPRLSIHRIDSNILDPKMRDPYNKKFVTKEARLRADPELLKLMVEPLYQSDPSCGVRELIQNAVDACNERMHLAKKDEPGYDGEVNVYLDREKKTLTVEDNGIGMGENVILNYYLAAGVSYRDSDEWLRTYAPDREPEIIRVGHFGVGVLATFLLGEQVKVTTWPLSEDLGYQFTFDLKPRQLDIERVNKEKLGLSPESKNPVGTTITVTLKDDALKKLLEDYDADEKTNGNKTWLNWYRFKKPSVKYWVNSKEVKEKQHKKGSSYVDCVPQTKGELIGWFDLQVTKDDEIAEKEKFEALLWGYPHDGFFCNGIRIPYGLRESYKYDDITIVSPSVSVINKKCADPEKRLPLDIARRHLDHFPPLRALGREIARYTMAQLLETDWTSREKAVAQWESGIPNVLRTGSNKPAPIVYDKNGYTLMHAQFWGRNKTNGKPSERKKRLLIFYIKKDTAPGKVVDLIRNVDPTKPFIILSEKNVPNETFDVRRVLESIHEFPFGKEYFDTEFCQVYLSKELYSDPVDNALFGKFSLEPEAEKERFFKYKYKKDTVQYPASDPPKPHFKEDQLDTDICLAILEVLCGPSELFKSKVHDGNKDDLWSFVKHSMKCDPWIPYVRKDRNDKLRQAFKELERYTKSHEAAAALLE